MGFKTARLSLSAAALVIAAAHVSAQATQALRVVPVVRGDYLVVNIDLRDGLTPEVLAAIDSGLKTTFTYTVDLKVEATLFRDRTVMSAIVANSVEFDNLQRKYTLERSVDGREVGKPEVTDSPAKVREWLTRLQDLQLFRTRQLVRNREYYVRVSASARPSYGSIWPFGSGTSAQTKFIFR